MAPSPGAQLFQACLVPFTCDLDFGLFSLEFSMGLFSLGKCVSCCTAFTEAASKPRQAPLDGASGATVTVAAARRVLAPSVLGV